MGVVELPKEMVMGDLYLSGARSPVYLAASGTVTRVKRRGFGSDWCWDALLLSICAAPRGS